MVTSIQKINTKYCKSLTSYERRKTVEVVVGNKPMGADNPIRIQSMTTTDTMNTDATVVQSIKLIEAGCEYIRITAPSMKEAENLRNIKKELLKRGYDIPLVADIHFTPNAAELAATIVEKVRVNPGNYADKKKFENIEYDDATYQSELDRIRKQFSPLVKICKAHNTAMRIGTNHGSLSDRIMSRYGDTPLGMVESALEFVRICENLKFYHIVLSMKASNTQIMVQAYRLLVQKLKEEKLKPYPLHLGVTEAGDGADGRIKSAMGIGTLLEDGLGDTVRVSLTEEPEFEIPVAYMLVNRYILRAENANHIPKIIETIKSPFKYEKRVSTEVVNFGDKNVPRVISDLSRMNTIQVSDLKSIGHFYLPAIDKWTMNDHGADYVYTGSNKMTFMLPNGLKEISDYTVWKRNIDPNNYPMLDKQELFVAKKLHSKLNFLKLQLFDIDEQLISVLEQNSSIVLILDTDNEHAMPELRRIFFKLYNKKITNPIVIQRKYSDLSNDQIQLFAATDFGSLLIDGWGDGVILSTSMIEKLISKKYHLKLLKEYNSLVFGILQAARTRMTKTEYISCPSCGRTLFDLQETTALIRKRTDHLKGVKIGIMGCIVNGPGEMADADFGYVGSGKGKITLYKGQEVVKRRVPSDKAVDELINIIKENKRWVET